MAAFGPTVNTTDIPCPAWLRAWFARPSLDAWIRERVRKMNAATLTEAICLKLTLPEDFRRETGQEPPADLDEQVGRAYREEYVRSQATPSPVRVFWDALMKVPEPTTLTDSE